MPPPHIVGQTTNTSATNHQPANQASAQVIDQPTTIPPAVHEARQTLNPPTPTPMQPMLPPVLNQRVPQPLQRPSIPQAPRLQQYNNPIRPQPYRPPTIINQPQFQPYQRNQVPNHRPTEPNLRPNWTRYVDSDTENTPKKKHQRLN